MTYGARAEGRGGRTSSPPLPAAKHPIEDGRAWRCHGCNNAAAADAAAVAAAVSAVTRRRRSPAKPAAASRTATPRGDAPDSRQMQRDRRAPYARGGANTTWVVARRAGTCGSWPAGVRDTHTGDAALALAPRQTASESTPSRRQPICRNLPVGPPQQPKRRQRAAEPLTGRRPLGSRHTGLVNAPASKHQHIQAAPIRYGQTGELHNAIYG